MSMLLAPSKGSKKKAKEEEAEKKPVSSETSRE
jgi:hypothetical protein